MAQDIAVATITLALTPSDAEKLRKSLEALCSYGFPIFVGEGGSLGPFRQSVATFLNVILVDPLPPGGLVRQVKAALHELISKTEAEWILYTEPDKEHFFRTQVPALLQHIETSPQEVGLVLASRTEAALSTFPAGQRLTENLINAWTGQTLGSAGDYTYGPFLVRRSVARIALDSPDDLGWGWRFYLFARVISQGLRLEHVALDAQCPQDQRDEDDAIHRDYRVRQLAQNASGLALGLLPTINEPARTR